MENGFHDLFKRANIHVNKWGNQSLYNSNKLESEYLVWAPLFSNTAWTLLHKLSVISLSSLQE